MKISIGNKLAGLLCLFGLILSSTASYYSLSSSKQILVDAAKRDLMIANHVLGRNLQVSLQAAANDLHVLARQSQPKDVLAGGPGSSSEALELTQLFESMLQAQPEYQRIRLISAQQHGIELIHVDRKGAVLGNNLKEAGHFPYVFETLKLQPGQLFISDISPSRLDPDRTITLRLASPIWLSNSQPDGVLVLNIDMATLIAQLQSELPDYYQLYLANNLGELLLNPAIGKSRGLIQNQVAAIQELLDGRSDSLLTALPSQRGQDARLGAFSRVKIVENATNTLLLGLTVPEQNILQASQELDQRLIQIIATLSLLTLLLSLWLARFLIQPFNQISLAIAHFTKDRSLHPLPTQRNDELGQLARDIRTMQERITTQIGELHSSQLELQHMAHNDPLTDLPNRRLFFDRLQHAIAKAARSGKQIGLLYVDIDHFKDINDQYGHAAGDEVLRNVARLLASITRVGDTVARLGGDEFVILFDEVESRTVLLSIAQKLLALLKNRLLIGGTDLQVCASVGISLYPDDASDAQALLQNADKAMYRSKHDGRNRISMA